jgi:hypothetical protein
MPAFDLIFSGNSKVLILRAVISFEVVAISVNRALSSPAATPPDSFEALPPRSDLGFQ